MVDRVVAEAGRVAQRVPGGDEDEHSEQRQRRAAVSSRHCRGPPAALRTAVGAAEQRQRRPPQDLQVEQRRAVLDVPDVELDPVCPRQRRAAVNLRPAGQARPDVEPLALPLGVRVDLVAQRRPRPDQAHLAADDVPELRQLVDRGAAKDAADARDPAVAGVDGVARRPGARRRRPSCGA